MFKLTYTGWEELPAYHHCSRPNRRGHPLTLKTAWRKLHRHQNQGRPREVTIENLQVGARLLEWAHGGRDRHALDSRRHLQ